MSPSDWFLSNAFLSLDFARLILKEKSSSFSFGDKVFHILVEQYGQHQSHLLPAWSLSQVQDFTNSKNVHVPLDLEKLPVLICHIISCLNS